MAQHISRRNALNAGLIVLTAIVLPIHAARADNRYGPGVTDAEIKLGQTMPYSGPASPLGTIGRAQIAYFQKINSEGGVNGRRIRLISLDDAFNPAKTVEQTRRRWWISSGDAEMICRAKT